MEKKLGKQLQQQQQQQQSKNTVDISTPEETTRVGLASAQKSFDASQTTSTVDSTKILPSHFLMTISGEISVFDVHKSNGSVNDSNEVNSKLKAEDGAVKPAKLRIQSQSEFATAVVLLDAAKLSRLINTNSETSKDTHTKTSTNSGLYLEYEIKTGGLAQIGWIRAPSSSPPPSSTDDLNVQFLPNSDTGDGVGDDSASYGYDGSRGLKFHGGVESPYGNPFESNVNGRGDGGDPEPTEWRAGDVLGCWCIFHYEQESNRGGKKKSMEIGYSLNGISLGSAFTLDLDVSDDFALYPALSLNLGEVLDVNVGPDFTFDVKEACVGVSECIKMDMGRYDGDVEDLESDAGEDETNDEDAKAEEGDESKSFEDNVSPPRKKQREEGGGDDEKVDNLTIKKASKPAAKPFDLNICQSVDELKSLGADELKRILLSMGLKCGGTIDQRAERLFSLKGLRRDEYPSKVRGKNFIP